jgi:hypothetical protein
VVSLRLASYHYKLVYKLVVSRGPTGFVFYAVHRAGMPMKKQRLGLTTPMSTHEQLRKQRLGLTTPTPACEQLPEWLKQRLGLTTPTPTHEQVREQSRQKQHSDTKNLGFTREKMYAQITQNVGHSTGPVGLSNRSSTHLIPLLPTIIFTNWLSICIANL